MYIRAYRLFEAVTESIDKCQFACVFHIVVTALMGGLSGVAQFIRAD